MAPIIIPPLDNNWGWFEAAHQRRTYTSSWRTRTIIPAHMMRETSNATSYGTVENERFLFLDIPGCSLLGLYVHRQSRSLMCSFSKPQEEDRQRTVHKTLEISADIRGDCDWEYLYIGRESHFYVKIAADNGAFTYLYNSQTNTFTKIRQYQYNSAKRWYLESHMPSPEEKYVSKTRDLSAGEEYMFVRRSQPEPYKSYCTTEKSTLRKDRMIEGPSYISDI